MSDGAAWRLTAHACSRCLGRIVVSDDLFACSSCGAVSEFAPDDICGCGLAPRRDGARYRCTPNPDRSAMPAEIVIAWSAPTLTRPILETQA